MTDVFILSFFPLGCILEAVENCDEILLRVTEDFFPEAETSSGEAEEERRGFGAAVKAQDSLDTRARLEEARENNVCVPEALETAQKECASCVQVRRNFQEIHLY